MAKRGKIPSLITGSSGKTKVISAGKKRKCNRCQGEICKADLCIEIPKTSGGFSNNKSHCDKCFDEILKQTYKDLQSIAENIKSFKIKSMID